MKRKSIYRKMAAQNIKKNAKMYFPYILTFVGMAAMYYIICSLSLNPTLANMKSGARTSVRMLGFGTWIVAIFAVIFLFYTNSFLIKRRKKELGLYNILGMEKRHVSRVLMWENISVLAIGLIFGLTFGVLFDKLMFMILLKMLGEVVPLTFHFSLNAFINTILLFLAISVLIHLNSMRQVHFSKPVDLLKGGNVGEREPKAKLIIAILGTISLVAGYCISITTSNPMDAFGNLFIAVVLVIIGTYLLFTAGSIALLKLLRKNKKYYYKSNHFISISGMMYRMKQNAVGLANICILSCAVIITISSTVALRMGAEESVRSLYPYDVMTALTNITDEGGNNVADARDLLHSTVDGVMSELGLKMGESEEFSLMEFYAQREGDNFVAESYDYEALFYSFMVMTADEYNRIVGDSVSLEENEVLIYTESDYNSNKMKIFDNTYSIIQRIDSLPDCLLGRIYYTNNIFLVVKDQDISNALKNEASQFSNLTEAETRVYYYFNIDGGEKEKRIAVLEEFSKTISELLYNHREYSFGYSYGGYDQELDQVISICSGLLFVGIFLGILFLMATVLIIYYKQITEGHEDFSRYEIMQKVGLTPREIKSSINSQVMTVFFLPLVTAAIHMCFAFPVMNKFLDFMELSNTNLYLVCMAASMAIFAVIYVIIYMVTSKIYYGIVTQKKDY